MSDTMLMMAAGKALDLISRLRHDKRGVAAVEFAMVVPIMFIMFVGAVEFSQALTVDRRVTQSASSSADLVARAPAAGLTEAEVDGNLAIVTELMRPYDVSPLTVKIISVKAVNQNGTLKYIADWQRDNKGTATIRSTDYTGIPDGLLAAGESVIIADTSYTYTPLIFNYFITSALSLTDKFYLKPRNSTCVTLQPVNCVTS